MRSENHDIFTAEFDKIALSGNNYKRIQSLDSVEIYLYGTHENIMHKRK